MKFFFKLLTNYVYKTEYLSGIREALCLIKTKNDNWFLAAECMHADITQGIQDSI